jgi:hypothetical protein
MGGSFSGKSTPENNNLETYYLIWLDGYVNKSPDNIIAQEKLRTLINQLKPFEDGKTCEEYIRSLSETDRIVFIVSGASGKDIIPRVHQLRQILSIYIYCINKTKYEHLANDFIKVNSNFIFIFILFVLGARCFYSIR